MAKFWVREQLTGNLSTPALHFNQLIYHNNSTLSTTGQRFKATAVAQFYMGLTDIDDLWILRLVLMHESVTPTVSTPGDSEEAVRGLYPFAKGPVYFAPRASITVPSDHKLWLQVSKVLGTSASIYQVSLNVLMVTSG